MLNVKDDWDKVKVGDRVKVYWANGRPMWSGVVVSKGNREGSGYVTRAYFKDCLTYNQNGTIRKGGAVLREREQLPQGRKFEIVKPIPDNLPRTFGELTDEHIGMRFEVDGTPPMTGTFEGTTDTKRYMLFEEVMWRDREIDKWVSKNSFNSKRGVGYNADARTPIRYVGGNPENQPDEVDVDAKLAAYFNQELDKAAGYGPDRNVHAGSYNKGKNYGEHIVEIMKKLTN